MSNEDQLLLTILFVLGIATLLRLIALSLN